MLRILKSLLVILAVTAVAVGATSAYFSDTIQVAGNTFTAGTLELNVDGTRTPSAKFNVSNMRPDSQPKGSWTLANVGSINGYLDLENISVVNQENGCNGAEVAAGDLSCNNPGVGEGELQDVVNLRLFVDRDGDGWISAGDLVFYDGKVRDLPSSFDLNEPIYAGSSTEIVALFDWWPTPSDDLAQGDSFVLDLSFELAQTTGQ